MCTFFIWEGRERGVTSEMDLKGKIYKYILTFIKCTLTNWEFSYISSEAHFWYSALNFFLIVDSSSSPFLDPWEFYSNTTSKCIPQIKKHAFWNQNQNFESDHTSLFQFYFCFFNELISETNSRGQKVKVHFDIADTFWILLSTLLIKMGSLSN